MQRHSKEHSMSTATATRVNELKKLQRSPLATPTDLTAEATRDVSGALNALLADVFALYIKTKNFHWHLSGPHFRDYHLMFDEQGTQIFAMTDVIAERVRKIGGSTIKSIGQIARLQRVLDNDVDYVDPDDMLAELCEDNKNLTARLREVHDVCSEFRDMATTSVIETWIDETERRTWFLFEASRPEATRGH
jgi:starvation-inducible DNA-binding protein